MWEGLAGSPAPRQKQALTCFSEREVIFGVVHSEDRVVVGRRHPALGWGALVERAVLCFPGENRQTGGRVSQGVTAAPDQLWPHAASRPDSGDQLSTASAVRPWCQEGWGLVQRPTIVLLLSGGLLALTALWSPTSSPPVTEGPILRADRGLCVHRTNGGAGGGRDLGLRLEQALVRSAVPLLAENTIFVCTSRGAKPTLPAHFSEDDGSTVANTLWLEADRSMESAAPNDWPGRTQSLTWGDRIGLREEVRRGGRGVWEGKRC